MSDLISRQAAIDAIEKYDFSFPEYMERFVTELRDAMKEDLKDDIANLPSAQAERTCVNCGRTANNGGWYADGRTRCPIEEHYALPKDGFCHLWEKRNITDDDYPERREDERPESWHMENYCGNCGARMDGDEKNCDTCKHYDKGWDDAICDGCTTADSRWERKDDEDR